MALTLIGCKKVLSTDLENILENTKINFERNFLGEELNKIELLPLEWGNTSHLSNIKQKIDLLVCSECLYLEAPWEKLLDTILALTHPNLEIVFAYKKRYSMQEMFIEKFSNLILTLEKLYVCESVPKDKFYEEFQKDEAYEILIAKPA